MSARRRRKRETWAERKDREKRQHQAERAAIAADLKQRVAESRTVHRQARSMKITTEIKGHDDPDTQRLRARSASARGRMLEHHKKSFTDPAGALHDARTGAGLQVVDDPIPLFPKGRGTTVVMQRRHDAVNSPRHYTSNPSGVEAIDVVEHMTFNVGNAVKYLWRLGLKGDAVEDLEKARWYVDREIQKLKKEAKLGQNT